LTELIFEDARVSVRGRTLLDGITLKVRAGDFVALVGPNGAGKSVLLKSALGLFTPTGGHILIADRSTRLLTPRERARELAWLPQHARVDEPLSAVESVAAARYRFFESHSHSLEHALTALERAGARHFAERKLTELSGGERQRVALAALIAQQAPLLLVDEPANHLDPAQQMEAYGLLGELWRRGAGMFCVTHDVNLLRHVGAPEKVRIVGLSEARLRFELTMDSESLPSALAELFGVAMRALSIDGQRVIVPYAGSSAPGSAARNFKGGANAE
jgi:iron complex transport system ATP-binding protein